MIGGTKLNLMTALNLRYPIIQAPMAGITTPKFVAASAEAGVLGSIGAGYLSAEQTQSFIREVQGLTDQPFAVNLFIPEQIEENAEVLQEAKKALQPIRDELSMLENERVLSESEYHEQIEVVIEEHVEICSFTFGLPNQETIQQLKENHVFLIGTATTVEEALLAERAGMDAVVAQGSEAGGHRGSFHGELRFIPLHELLSDIIKVVKIPVIAAGGIANKEQMESALVAGVSAVQIGTALLTSDESGANPQYKQAILNAEKGCTAFTRAFSGKTARGIRNRFMKELEHASIAPYPYQNDLTKGIRKAAAVQEKSEFMSLWAGENVHLNKSGSVENLIKEFK